MSFLQRVQTYLSEIILPQDESTPMPETALNAPLEPVNEQEVIVHDFGGHFGLAWVTHQPNE